MLKKLNSRQKNALIIFAILVFALLIRLSFISKGPYHADCLLMAINAEATVKTHKLHFAHSHGHPLVAMIAAVFVRIFNFFSITDPVKAVNFMSVLLSSLSLLAFYIFVQKLLDRRTALLSTILFSISPIFLVSSVYGNTHTPFMLFLLLGLYFILNFHRSKRYRDVVLSALFLGFAGASRIQDLIAMAPVIGLLFIMDPFHKKQKITKGIQAGLVAAGLSSIIILCFYTPVFLVKYPGNTFNQFMLLVRNEGAQPFIGFNSFLFARSFGFFIRDLFFIGCLFVVFGIIALLKDNRKVALILLFWILGTFTIYSSSLVVAARFFIITLPPLYITIGYALNKINSSNKAVQLLSVLLITINFSITFLTVLPVLHFRHTVAHSVDFAKKVGRKTEPNSLIISTDEHSFYEYYAGRKSIYRPANEYALQPESLLRFKKDIDFSLQKGLAVYITYDGLANYNPQNTFSDFMEAHYNLWLVTHGLCEDWHQDAGLSPYIYHNALYKIEPK